MTDISREAVDALCETHAGYLQHGTAATLQALRAALDEAEAERDAANALLREARSGLCAYTGGASGACEMTISRIDAHLGAKP